MVAEIKNSSELAEIVRNERRRQHVTQVQLSQLANVGVRFIRDLEDGKATLQFDKVLHVLYTLGVAVSLSVPGENS